MMAIPVAPLMILLTVPLIRHGGTGAQGEHCPHHYAYNKNQLYASHRRYLLLSRARLVSPAVCSYPLSITYMWGLGMRQMDYILQLFVILGFWQELGSG
jgi:hypothetical protein